MEQPRKILVPVDLSKRSERAIGYAAMIAKPFNSKLVLFNNISVEESEALEEFAGVEGLTVDGAAEAALRSLANEHAPGSAISVLTSFGSSAADAILDAADASDADAIVLTSHGRTGMGRWLLGSVAERVARSAEIPVMIIPARDI